MSGWQIFFASITAILAGIGIWLKWGERLRLRGAYSNGISLTLYNPMERKVVIDSVAFYVWSYSTDRWLARIPEGGGNSLILEPYHSRVYSMKGADHALEILAEAHFADNQKKPFRGKWVVKTGSGKLYEKKVTKKALVPLTGI